MDLNEAMEQLRQNDTSKHDTTSEGEDQGEIEKSDAVETEADTQDTAAESGSETEVTEDDTSDDDTTPKTYEVPYGDDVEHLTLDELIKGNMRERDYRFKLGEASKVAKKAQAKLEKLDQKLFDVEVELDQEAKWFDSDEAKEQRELDPDAYLQRLEKAQDKARRYNEAKQLRDEERAEQNQEIAKQEGDKLLERLPEWHDKSVMEAEAKAAAQVLNQYGFTDEEIGQFGTKIDHRHLWMANELAKLQAIQSQDLTGKKVNKAPRSASPESPASKEQLLKKQRQEKMAKLKKTGRMEDAVALLRG